LEIRQFGHAPYSRSPHWAISKVGLPQHEIPLAWLMFNVGVELGQLVFVIRQGRRNDKKAPQEIPPPVIHSGRVWAASR